MLKYEYKLFKPRIKGWIFKDWDNMHQAEEQLNKLGNEGWEVVATFPIQTGSRGIFSDSGETSGFVALMKRQVK